MSSEQHQPVEHHVPETPHYPQQHRLGRAVLRGLARHPWAGILPLVALIVLGLSLAVTGMIGPRSHQASTAEVLGAQTTNQAPLMATQSMEAMKTLDAKAFWGAMDERMQQSLAAQGVQGQEGVAQMFSQIRAAGAAIQSYEFIARYDTGTGETVSFFVAKRRGPNGQEADVPFLITTNSEGLVTKLE